MPLQPLARRKSGAAFCTPASNSFSVPGFTSICAISRNMAFPFRHSGRRAKLGCPESILREPARYRESVVMDSGFAGCAGAPEGRSRRDLAPPALERGDRLVRGLHVAEVGIEGA